MLLFLAFVVGNFADIMRFMHHKYGSVSSLIR